MSTRSAMLLAASNERVGFVAIDAQVFWQRDQAIAAQAGELGRILVQTNRGDARNGRDHRLALVRANCAL